MANPNPNMDGLRRNPGKGRPKGIPNKASLEIKAFAQQVLSSPSYVASLVKRLEAGKAPHMETLLSYYAFGKPKEQVEHSGEVSLPTVVRHEFRNPDS